MSDFEILTQLDKTTETIEIPDGITIIYPVFINCVTLKKVIIPDSLTHIKPRAFMNCYNLEEVICGNNITFIKRQCFLQCYKLRNIKLNDSLKSIGDLAFSCCKSLPNIKIPNSVEYIGESAFASCDKLQRVEMSNSIEIINKKTFSFCMELTDVIFPKDSKVSVIDEKAFNFCKFTTFEIPDSVKRINNSVFTYCKFLKKIILGKSLGHIGKGVFIACENLSTVIFLSPKTLFDLNTFLKFNEWWKEYSKIKFFRRAKQTLRNLAGDAVTVEITYELRDVRITSKVKYSSIKLYFL